MNAQTIELTEAGLVDIRIAHVSKVFDGLERNDQGIDYKRGLFLSPAFCQIKDAIKSVEEEKKFSLRFYDKPFGTAATDSDLKKALPEAYAFDESEAVAIVAELIYGQFEGGPGALRNLMQPNLFYTPNQVLSATWSVGGCEWCVHAWGHDAQS